MGVPPFPAAGLGAEDLPLALGNLLDRHASLLAGAIAICLDWGEEDFLGCAHAVGLHCPFLQ